MIPKPASCTSIDSEEERLLKLHTVRLRRDVFVCLFVYKVVLETLISRHLTSCVSYLKYCNASAATQFFPVNTTMAMVKEEACVFSEPTVASQALNLASKDSTVARKTDMRQHSTTSTMSWQETPQFNPDEVIIYFAKGSELTMIDRTLICNSSTFFDKAFNGQFQGSRTGKIRLRGDFPYGVKAMIMFLKEGYYSFDPLALKHYPRLTMLDMHVHAYILANKYMIPTLAQHAISAYVQIAHRILKDYVQYHISLVSHTWLNVRSLGHHRDDTPVGEVEQLLESMSLLWKNTVDPLDAMRFAVLDVIAPFLNKLARLKIFAMMCLHLDGFEEGLKCYFGYQGMDFRIIKTPFIGRYDLRFFNTSNDHILAC
ncbi:unnamed protein product [Periconia digitata]|uniref:BTB domain-containing protein n=1 Tax=Periconia digitata TaxID=1303443 RepID=A0A9W4US97_9PLEO|nr:unnamed protein product [Periconia digitata]